MNRIRRMGVAAVAVALLAVPAPAHASNATVEGPRLNLSVDGEVWVQDITTPVFEPAHVWVPGDSMTYTVMFRNDSGETAEGFGTLALEGAANDLLHTRLRVDGGGWKDGPQSEVVQVAPGQVVRLDMELSLPTGGVNPRTALYSDLQATVTLRGEDGSTGNPDPDPDPDGGNTGTDPDGETGLGGGANPDQGAGTTPGAGAPDGTIEGEASQGSGSLASTGSSLLPWPLFAAGALLLTGQWLWLVARRRRRQS